MRGAEYNTFAKLSEGRELFIYNFYFFLFFIYFLYFFFLIF